MKNFKYKVVRFIANLLDVTIVAPLLHTINISHNGLTSFDLSKGNLDKFVSIDITGCDKLKRITFPKGKMISIEISEIKN